MNRFVPKRTLSCILILPIFLFGCENPEKSPSAEGRANLSNLADGESREAVAAAATAAGIPEENLNLFFSDVEEYNQTIENTDLVRSGFAFFDGTRPDYDWDRISALWGQKYSQFLGYNCKMTAFTLLKGKVSCQNPSKVEKTELDTFLSSDQTKDFVQNHFTKEEIQTHDCLFPALEPDESGGSAAECAERFRQKWRESGISFSDRITAKLICVMTDDPYLDRGNVIHAEHAGVLFPAPEGGWLFLEKISFSLPYQAIRFSDRNCLYDYLTNIYARDGGLCFILENDRLMERE